jgi:hypothetical protein
MGVLERLGPIAAWTLAFAGLACCASGEPASAHAYTLGDSIGEGVIDQIDATPIGADYVGGLCAG